MPQLEFTRRFAMAHRLLADPSSKCAVPHGHNEFVTVTLATDARPDWGGANMAAPFERLKTRWPGWIDGAVDHALQLDRDDPLVGFFRAHEPERLPRLMLFEGDPTTEAAAVGLRREAETRRAGLDLTIRPVGPLLELDDSLKARGLNPGTSADFTVATLFWDALTAAGAALG